MLLYTVNIGGHKERVVSVATKEGTWWMYDAKTGAPIHEHVKLLNQLEHPALTPGKPVLVYPSSLGGLNYSPSSFDPTTGYVINNQAETASVLIEKANPHEVNKYKIRGDVDNGLAAGTFGYAPKDWHDYGSVTAIDAARGKIAWKFVTPEPGRGGITTTAEGLGFAPGGDGVLRAFDTLDRQRTLELPDRPPDRGRPVDLRGARQGVHRDHGRRHGDLVVRRHGVAAADLRAEGQHDSVDRPCTAPARLGPGVLRAPPVYLSAGAEPHSLELQLVASLNDPSGKNTLDGLSHGGMTVQVPKGWQVNVTFVNHARSRSDGVAVVSGAAGGAPVFGGGQTAQAVPASGISYFQFTASRTGDYRIASTSAGRAAAGEWIHLNVVSASQPPEFIASPTGLTRSWPGQVLVGRAANLRLCLAGVALLALTGAAMHSARASQSRQTRSAIVAPPTYPLQRWDADKPNLVPAQGTIQLDGSPVAGVQVRVDNYDVPALTDAQGHFVYLLDDTLLGRHVVSVDDATQAKVAGRSLSAGERSRLMASNAAITVAYAVHDLKVSRDSAGRPVVSGRLANANGAPPPLVGLFTYQLTGTVTDADGKPVVGAQVSTRTQDRDYWTVSTMTDANGRYSSLFTASAELFSNPVPFTVRVSKGDVVYQFLSQEVVYFQRLQSARMNIQLPPRGYPLALPLPESYPGAVYSGVVVGVAQGAVPVRPVSTTWLDQSGRFRIVLPAKLAGKTVSLWEGKLNLFSRKQARAGAPIDLLQWPGSLPRGVPRGLVSVQLQGLLESGRELGQEPHAGAARARAEVVAVLVEERGRVDVEVRPRHVADEPLEEGRRDDRVAEAPARRVPQIGERRVEQPPVAAVQRPGPGVVAARLACGDDLRTPGVVVREHSDVEVAERAAHRPGQGRHVDQVRRALLLREPEAVGQHEPALRVGVRDLDGQAGRRPDDVAGTERGAVDHVLGRGKHGDEVDGELELRDRADRADHRGAAAHVGLLADDVALRLQEVAAGVERDRLPDEPEPLARLRRAGEAEHDQPRLVDASLPDRGEGAEAAPLDLGQVERLDRDPERLEELRGRARQACGRQLVRRRVHKLSRAVRPAGDELGAIGRRLHVGRSAAEHEQVRGARSLAGLPARGVVAAEQRSLDDRVRLPGRLERQLLVEGPDERAAAEPGGGAGGRRRRRAHRVLVECLRAADPDERDSRRRHGVARREVQDRRPAGVRLRLAARDQARETPAEQVVEAAETFGEAVPVKGTTSTSACSVSGAALSTSTRIQSSSVSRSLRQKSDDFV